MYQNPRSPDFDPAEGELGGREGTGEKIRRAIENSGIEFIDENGTGEGVQFRKPRRTRRNVGMFVLGVQGLGYIHILNWEAVRPTTLYRKLVSEEAAPFLTCRRSYASWLPSDWSVSAMSSYGIGSS